MPIVVCIRRLKIPKTILLKKKKILTRGYGWHPEQELNLQPACTLTGNPTEDTFAWDNTPINWAIAARAVILKVWKLSIAVVIL